MTDEPREQMSAETRELLGELTRDDVAMIKAGIPIIRAIVGFGRVMKWIVIVFGGLLAGVIFLGESAQKLISWFWPPPH
jgi:hypothetical protein